MLPRSIGPCQPYAKQLLVRGAQPTCLLIIADTAVGQHQRFKHRREVAQGVTLSENRAITASQARNLDPPLFSRRPILASRSVTSSLPPVFPLPSVLWGRRCPHWGPQGSKIIADMYTYMLTGHSHSQLRFLVLCFPPMCSFAQCKHSM
jgi:hypothetical protein